MVFKDVEGYGKEEENNLVLCLGLIKQVVMDLS